MKEFKYPNNYTVILSNSKELKEDLMNNFKFEIYYTKSLNYAYLHPHIGHLLEEDIQINQFIIKKNSLLFYNSNRYNLEIIDCTDKNVNDFYFYLVSDYRESLKYIDNRISNTFRNPLTGEIITFK